MNSTGYTVLKTEFNSGAIVYAKGAREFATGATGAGGYLNAQAVASGWNTVDFINVVGAGVSLPTYIGAGVSDPAYGTAAATIIGGSTPIGDLRGEAGGYYGIGTTSSRPFSKGTVYDGAFYAVYKNSSNPSTTTATGKIGIGTLASEISTSGYYEGSFTTSDSVEHTINLPVDTNNLQNIITGSGVYTNGDAVTLQFNLVNRNGDILTSAAAIEADPFISEQRISILDIDGNVAYPNYRISTNPTFTFTRSQNIDVFGTFTKNYGIQNEVVNFDGGIQTTKFFLRANEGTIDRITVLASGVNDLNETAGNYYPPETGSITSEDDRLDAIKYFNHQPVNASGVTGYMDFILDFQESPNYISLGDVLIFAGDQSGFATNEGSLVGTYPLEQIKQGQSIRLTSNDGIQEGTPLFFKFAIDSRAGYRQELFNVGPYTLEPQNEGPDLNLYNQGDQTLVGDFTIQGGLNQDDNDGGNLYVSGNAYGLGQGDRLTGPSDIPYLLSGDVSGVIYNLQETTDAGNTTTNNIGIGTTDTPTVPLVIVGDSSKEGVRIFDNADTTNPTIELKTDSSEAGVIKVNDTAGVTSVEISNDSSSQGQIEIKDSSGTTKVTAKLDANAAGEIDVKDAADNTSVKLGSDSNDAGIIEVNDSAGVNSVEISSDTDSKGQFKVKDAGGVTRVVATIGPNNAGRFGIGTSTVDDNTALTIYNSGSTTSSLTVKQGTGIYPGFVGIGTDTPQFGLDASNIAKANIAAANSYIYSTGSAILGGATHLISGDFDVVVGGAVNKISGGNFNFIGGGSGIDITGSQFASSIGGFDNDIYDSNYAVIGGGTSNRIDLSQESFIGGGNSNTIENGGTRSTIAGGNENYITGAFSFIGGGLRNEVHANQGSILGGRNNIVSGIDSSILGGDQNKVFGVNSVVVASESSIISGDYANALGRQIKIHEDHAGATVIADGQSRDHLSSGEHTAVLDFYNGVYVETQSGLYVNGNEVLTGLNPYEDQNLDDVLAVGNVSSRDMQVETITGFQFEATGEVGLYLSGPYSKIRSDGDLQIQTDDTDTRATFGDNYFYLRNKYSANDVFRMDGGNAIIGSNTTPTAKLDVRGDVFVDGDIETSGNLYINHPTYNYLTGSIYINSANRFQIDYGTRKSLTAAGTSTTIYGDANTYVKAGNYGLDFKVGLGGQLKINEYWSDDDLAFYSHGGDKIMSIHTDASADSFVVASDGNVGIGTGDPSSLLHVYQTSSSVPSIVSRVPWKTNADAQLLQRAGLKIDITEGSTSMSIGGIGSANGGYIQAYQTNSASTYRPFVINPFGGRVGTNYTVNDGPDYDFDVNGTGRFVGDLYVDADLDVKGNAFISGSGVFEGAVSITETGATEVFSVDGSNGRLFGITDEVTGTVFSVNDAAGLPILEVESTSGYDKVTIGQYGTDALIISGTDTAKFNVDVYGTGAGDRITNNGIPYLLSGDAAASLTLQDVCDNGYTTTTPINISGAVTVANNIFKNVESSFLGLYGGSDTLTNDGFIKIHGNANFWGKVQTNIGYDATNSKAHWTLNDTTDLMTLKGNGYLGIGTGAPNDLLHLHKSSDPTLILSDDNTFKMAMTLDGTNGVLQSLNSIYGVHKSLASFDLNQGTMTTQNISMSPSTSTLQMGNNSHRIVSTANDFYITHTQSNYKGFRFLGNVPADTLVLESNGRVGIGTNSPNTKLHIKEDGYGFKLEGLTDGKYIRMRGDGSDAYIDAQGQNFLILNSSGNGVKVTSGSSSTRFIIGADSEAIFREGNTLKLRTNSTDRLFISSAGAVGIGTTNPIAELEVYQSGSDVEMLIHEDAGTHEARLHLRRGGSDWEIINNNDLAFEIEGSEVVRFKTNGNVGIGTNSPSAPLEIVTTGSQTLKFNGGANQYESQIEANGHFRHYRPDAKTYTVLRGSNRDIFVDGGGNVAIGPYSTTVEKKFVVNGESLFKDDIHVSGAVIYGDTTTPSLNLSNAGGAQLIYGSSVLNNGGSLVYSYGGTTKFRVNGSDGSVGIGTNSPTTKLDVRGNTFISGSVSGTGAGDRITLNNIPYLLSGDEAGATNTLQDVCDNGYETTTSLISSGPYISGVSGLFSGYVGIGTNAPAEALEVVGNVEADEFIGDLRGAVSFKGKAGEDLSKGDVIYISGIQGNTTIVSKADADDPLRMPAFGIVKEDSNYDNPVTVVNFGAIGNLDTSAYSVGEELYISTTAGLLTGVAPTGEGALLQKMAKVTRSDNSAGSITVMGAGRTNAVPNLNRGHIFVGNSSNQSVADDTVFVDIANTRVGINDISPSYQLSVSGDVQTNAIRGYSYPTYNILNLEDDYITNANGVTLQSVGSMAYYIDVNNNSSNDLFEWFADDNSAGSATSLMKLTDEGYLGIGTAGNPSRPLDVQASATSVIANFKYTAAGYASIDISSTQGFARLSSVNNDLLLSPAGTERMRVLSGGNVGIGVSDPDQKLEVSGNIKLTNYTDDIQFGGTANMLSYNQWQASASGGMSIKNIAGTSTGHIAFETSAGEKVRILRNGNVGIGTTNPSAKLHVTPTNTYDGITIKGNIVPRVVFNGSNSGSNHWGVGIHDNQGNNFAIGHNTVGHDEMSDYLVITPTGNVGIGVTNPDVQLEVGGDIKLSKDAGIHVFTDTISSSSSEDIFSVSNTHGAQAFRVTFVCSTAGYSVAKTYEVVHQYNENPVYFKVVDTGPYGGHDFDVSFTDLSNAGVKATITNNSSSINADITTTLFLGGSPTSVTVTALS